jgi:hypothetical protein
MSKIVFLLVSILKGNISKSLTTKNMGDLSEAAPLQTK